MCIRDRAKDGTVKYLLRMADGNCIETVVMRYHYGNTVCVSTQVGCRTVSYTHLDVYKRQPFGPDA